MMPESASISQQLHNRRGSRVLCAWLPAANQAAPFEAVSKTISGPASTRTSSYLSTKLSANRRPGSDCNCAARRRPVDCA